MKKSKTKPAWRKLGKKIRQTRKEQNISQAQLAYESGLSREEIYRLELGYINPTYDTLAAIAEALGIQVKELVDFEC
ncbi:MAG: helix-turn-helix transcriptional regulator [Bacteroidetes bacterium]|nr:helix-turn-helix transcriptional regulator [Bacteroidota bacterium]